MRRFATIATIALATSGALAAEKIPKQAQRLMAMTPDDFRQIVQTNDDSLEVRAVLTTQAGFQEKRGLLGIVWSDSFLRAFVDKSSGAVSYQLYESIRYVAPSWRFYKLGNYEAPGGPKSIPVTEISRDVDCSSARLYGGCMYNEIVAVPVDEELLRTIASKYVPNSLTAWRFKFKAQSGADFDDFMVAAEPAGLLAAVDNYRAAHNLVKP